MVTEFKIFENKEQELLEMGYGIYLYNNIFFKKSTRKKDYVQYDIQQFLRTKETLTVNHVFSRMLDKEVGMVVVRSRTVKNWENDFSRDHKEIFTYTLIDKLVDIMLKKKLIEQFCIIKYVILEMYEDVPNDVLTSKKMDSIANLLRIPKIERIVEIVLDYYDEREGDNTKRFNKKLGYRKLGKTIDEVKETIDNFHIDQEMTKYNI